MNCQSIEPVGIVGVFLIDVRSKRPRRLSRGRESHASRGSEGCGEVHAPKRKGDGAPAVTLFKLVFNSASSA